VTAYPLLSSRNLSCGIDDGLEGDGFEDGGYGYVIMMITVFTLLMTLTFVNVLLIYACYSLYVQT
jgi:hypothetical protein